MSNAQCHSDLLAMFLDSQLVSFWASWRDIWYCGKSGSMIKH